MNGNKLLRMTDGTTLYSFPDGSVSLTGGGAVNNKFGRPLRKHSRRGKKLRLNKGGHRGNPCAGKKQRNK